MAASALSILDRPNRIAIVDGTTHDVVKYLLVGQRAWHGALTPDEKYLLVANGMTNDVSVVDVAGQKVVKSIQIGEMPWGIAVSPGECSSANCRQRRYGSQD